MHYNVYIQNTGLVSEFANDESGQRDHYEKDYMLNLEHERAFSHNLCNAHQEVFGSAVIPTKQLICGEQGRSRSFIEIITQRCLIKVDSIKQSFHFHRNINICI